MATNSTANDEESGREIQPTTGTTNAEDSGREIQPTTGTTNAEDSGRQIQPTTGTTNDVDSGREIQPTTGTTNAEDSGRQIQPTTGTTNDVDSGREIQPTTGTTNDEDSGRQIQPTTGTTNDEESGRQIQPTTGTTNDVDSGRQIQPTTGTTNDVDSGRQIQPTTGTTNAEDSGREIQPTTGTTNDVDSGRQIQPTTGTTNAEDSGRQIQPTTGTTNDEESGREIQPTTGTTNDEEETDTPVFTMEDAPNGGKRAWLIVASCSVINALMGMIEFLVLLALLGASKDADTGMDATAALEIYLLYINLSSVYAPIGSVAIATLGYEVPIHVGSWCMGVAFFVLSFIDNVNVIKFMIYAIAGVGSSLVKLGILIPILEYFTTKRMRALMITNITKYVGQILLIIICVAAEAQLPWQGYFGICCGLCVPIGIVAISVSTLKMKKDGKILLAAGLSGLMRLEIAKDVLLWALCFLFFVYQIGVDPPLAALTDTEMLTTLNIADDVTKIVVYFYAFTFGYIVGAILGWLFKVLAKQNFGMCKETVSDADIFNIILILLGTMSCLLAIMCLIAPEAIDFPYFVIFILLYSAQLTFFEQLRDDVVPDIFGRENVKFAEGLIQMWVGIGGIIASESAVALPWKDSFRMGGGMLFVTMVVSGCFLVFGLHTDVALTNRPSDNSSSRNDVMPARLAMQAETSRTIIASTSSNPTIHVPTNMPDIVHLTKLQFETNHGPVNMRYLSHDASMLDTSTDESNIAGVTRQNHTIYTNIQTSRSPISHGLNQTIMAARSYNDGQLPLFYNIRSDSGPYYPVYSYNIVQQ